MEFHEIDRKLPEIPRFNYFRFQDINPLSRKQKTRIIGNPNVAMRIVHARLMRYLRELKIALPNATGAICGSSPLRNLNRHRIDRAEDGSPFNRYFYLLDLRNAYPSVQGIKLAEIIAAQTSLDIDKVETFLKRYCLKDMGGLVIGGPASPDLFNLYCEFVLDQQLRELARRYYLTYSRYLDDVTFSSSQPIGKQKRRALRQTILDASFEINHRKSQILDLNKGPVVINGIGVRRNGETFLPRHALRELRGMLRSFLDGRLVNPQVIHGKMGLFVHLTDCYYPNQTESKLLDMYSEFRLILRSR